jgi:RNA polymerase subunit RPABC4/transcription elongation factor Spt4
MSFKCPKCGAEFYERIRYCPECGLDFDLGQKKCPRCRERVAVDSNICPQCGLDFEKYAFLMPKLILLGILIVAVAAILLFPVIWKSTPWLHDKGIISEGALRTEVGGVAMVPLFINWRTGEKYISKSAEASHYGESTDYMDQLVPLPPPVVFHYDIPVGERVWIISRVNGITSDWVHIGRWVNGHDKYGWVHSSNVTVEENR